MPGFLVVDDSETVRMMVKAGIRKAVGDGVTISEADDAGSAVARFREAKPDAIFLDMMLARQSSGAAALDEILGEAPDTRVILVTGLPATHPDVIEAISRGAFAFVPKPVRADAIRDVLDQVQAEKGQQFRIR